MQADYILPRLTCELNMHRQRKPNMHAMMSVKIAAINAILEDARHSLISLDYDIHGHANRRHLKRGRPELVPITAGSMPAPTR